MHDGTPLNTFINLSTVGMCHLKFVNASQVKEKTIQFEIQHCCSWWNSIKYVCIYMYSDTSANEDNSFQNHIR